MTDVDDILRAELHRLVTVTATPDWDAVAMRAGLKRGQARRRAAFGLSLLAAAAVLGLATPLGSAIARGLGGFSAWLTGQPGTPASQSEQRAFERANARSWLGFPKGTKLRHLITQTIGSTKVDLLGFRSGTGTLCLRLTVTGKSRTSSVSCAPLADLRLEGAPVHVLLVDKPVGKGTKTAWYGIDHAHSSNLQITAGVAADSVRSVVLRDAHGRHTVPARSNAFLYVARDPEVGQRVRAVWARTARDVVTVPFSPSPFGGLGFAGVPQGRPAPIVHVERRVTGGRIGWLDRREKRGLPLSTLPARMRSALIGQHLGRVLFGRVLVPDPSAPYRVSVTLNAHRRGGPPGGICTMLVGPGSAGGGCAPYPDLFQRSPISFGTTGDGPAEFVRASGVATDDVARLQVALASGQRIDVPFVDNTFAVGISRANLPARLVGYGADGKVVAVSDPIGDLLGGSGPSPARGRAVQLLRVEGAHGEHAELLVGRATDGGACMYVKHFTSRFSSGVLEGCYSRAWHGAAVQLSNDPTFISGRVRGDVATVRLRFANGAAVALEPTRGYVLGILPRDGRLVSADGLARDGHLVARQHFPPPMRRR